MGNNSDSNRASEVKQRLQKACFKIHGFLKVRILI